MRATEESPNLDFLRTIAVGLVVIAHLLGSLEVHEPGHYHFQALGLLGVLLFFVHTSLVLMFSLERQHARHGDRSGYAVFLIRRVFRIYPLSVTVVLLMFGLARVGASSPFPDDAMTVLSNLLLIQNVTGAPAAPAPLWSLPFEMQMYLVLPALFVLAQRRRAVLSLLVLWAAVGAFVIALKLAHLNYHLVKFVPCFIPGVIAYALPGRSKKLPFWTLPAFLSAAAVAYPVLVASGIPENLLAWPVCLALGLLLPNLEESQSPALHRIAKVVARYSYGIYLTHAYALWLSVERYPEGTAAARIAAFLVATAVLSWAAYEAVEKPGLRLGGRLADRVLARGPKVRPQPSA